MGHGGKRPNQTGRPKGSRNKATAPIREAIASKDPIGKLFKIAEETEDDSLRVKALLGVLPYGFPRLAATRVDLEAFMRSQGSLRVEFVEED